ncbi:MAG: murein biosynthesis integral membrane protein MurJ [Chloroflexi bacterium]|nr:murein biosynthesis integral membrane protein MurJ [Chloroflexota bacterium]
MVAIRNSQFANQNPQSGLVGAAAIIAAGNVASRVLGLAREMVIAYLFGATGLVSVFRVAATIIQTLYDFLVGGMVSAALVPVFSDFASRENRDELWRVASIVLNALAIFLALAVLILELFAPQLVWLLGSGYDAELQRAAVEMLRLVLPAVFFLGMSGIVTGLLYSLKRFTFPAFTTAAYNAGIVIVALALTPIFGITSLIVGILVGSALQVILQLPALRDARYHCAIDFSHPALRKILKLYAPVVAGLSISVVSVVIDRNLASHTGAQSLAWMQNATVLVQLPLGLVATAIAFAILPELSVQYSVSSIQTPEHRTLNASREHFQSTLAFGIKLVLLLILPATVGLFILARPIVALVFERGAFTPADTTATALALQFYLLGLPFAAIDQPLVFAFYARKNTFLPNLVQFFAVAIYLVVALALVQPLGMIGLVIANSAMLTGHALMMLWLTHTRLGGFGRQGMIALTIKVIVASIAMGAVVFLIARIFDSVLWQVLASTLAAGAVYIALLRVLRVREAARVWDIVLARVRR